MHQLNLFNAASNKPVNNNISNLIVENIADIESEPTEYKNETEETTHRSDEAKKEVLNDTEFLFIKKDAKNSDRLIAASSGRGRKSYKEMDADVHLVEVPDDELLFQKNYYSISEVAQWFNVNASLIRFWENEFDILKPRKNRKGDRLFRPEDIKNLQLIYYLLRQRKFSIEGARQYLKDNRRKAELNMQLIQSLTKFRTFLLELRATLDA